MTEYIIKRKNLATNEEIILTEKTKDERYMLNCLVWVWSYSKDLKQLHILKEISETKTNLYGKAPYIDENGNSWCFCEPVRSNEINFAKD